MKNYFIIKDWAGNVLGFNELFSSPHTVIAKEFNSFDDAIQWLDDRFGDDEESLQEYNVEEIIK